MATSIKVIPEELHALHGKLSSIKNTSDAAISNVQRVRNGLTWEVSAKAAVDEQLAALQKRLQKHTELMGGYASFAMTAASQFEAKDKALRDKAKDILYQMDQITYVNTNIETIVPTLDFELAEALKQLMTIVGIFGGVTAPVIALIEYLMGLINGPVAVPEPLPPVPPEPVPPEPQPEPEPEPSSDDNVIAVTFVGVPANSVSLGGLSTKFTSNMRPIKVGETYAKAISDITPPTQDGKKCLGWAFDEAGKQPVTETTVCTKTTDHSLYPRWGIKVTYNFNGGTPATFVDYLAPGAKYDFDKVVAAQKVTKTRCKIYRWHEKANGNQSDGTNRTKGELKADAVCIKTTAHTVYAQWASPPIAHAIKINSKIGNRTFTLKGKKVTDYHLGVDLAAKVAKKTGDPLYAFVGGTITARAYHEPGYGYYVVMRGDDGWYYRYAHMEKSSNRAVKDRVDAGDQIGAMGSTGASTGPHLHFEWKTTSGGSNKTNIKDPLTRFKELKFTYK